MRKKERIATSSAPSIHKLLPEKVEYFFLILVLLSHLWLFFAHWGDAVGWDTDVHLQMLSDWPWSAHMWNIESQFYAYHPPLAFLLARVLLILGLDPVVSVQVVSAAASIIGFLFLRASLSALNILRTWRGLFFLIITSSLPLQVYLARSINMDVLIYAEACAALFFSIRVFFCDEITLSRNSVTTPFSLCLVLSLVLGLFTKYSGLLLLSIPLLVSIVHQCRCASILPRKNFRGVFHASCLCAIALAIAFPYYFERYEQKTGQFFPTNQDLDIYDKHMTLEERAVRDRDRITFLQQFFWGTSSDAVRMQDRDQKVLRILNTWKDVWSANKYNIEQSPLSLLLSRIYARLSLLFLGLGSISFLLQFRRWTSWDQLGVILLLFSLIEILSLLIYSYQYPHPIGIPNKGMYIAPALLGCGYLMTACIQPVEDMLVRHLFFARLCAYFGLLALASFLLLNALIPVY